MIINRKKYLLILLWNPCDIFKLLNVDKLHGLDLKSCEKHVNNNDQSYIAGWCNYLPKSKYKHGDRMFIFINLSRCRNDKETTAIVFHEILHRYFEIYKKKKWNEEKFITDCENETIKVVNIIKKVIKENKKK